MTRLSRILMLRSFDFFTEPDPSNGCESLSFLLLERTSGRELTDSCQVGDESSAVGRD
jgi:hypothetical protein